MLQVYPSCSSNKYDQIFSRVACLHVNGKKNDGDGYSDDDDDGYGDLFVANGYPHGSYLGYHGDDGTIGCHGCRSSHARISSVKIPTRQNE